MNYAMKPVHPAILFFPSSIMNTDARPLFPTQYSWHSGLFPEIANGKQAEKLQKMIDCHTLTNLLLIQSRRNEDNLTPLLRTTVDVRYLSVSLCLPDRLFDLHGPTSRGMPNRAGTLPTGSVPTNQPCLVPGFGRRYLSYALSERRGPDSDCVRRRPCSREGIGRRGSVLHGA